MAGKPIATQGSMHVCPMCSGLVPHVGGPISGPGAPNVLINGKPAALMGDMCVCVGPPDVVAQGNPSVLINGVPVVCQGDMTAHGGVIMSGEPNILISTSASSPVATMPIAQIPFPEIRLVDKLGAAMSGNSANLKQAQGNVEALRQEAEEQVLNPKIISVEIIDEETDAKLKENEMVEIIRVRAITRDILNGDSISFNLKRTKIKDEEGNKQEDEEVITLTGTVNDDVAIVEYEIPNYNNLSE